MNKKELKELEQKQNELRELRRRTIEAFRSYTRDCEATIRFYKINPDETKMKYGKLSLEETKKLLRRYKELDYLKPYDEYTKEAIDNQQDRVWEFTIIMNRTDIERNSYKDNQLTIRLEQDDLWIDDIIWSKEQTELYLKFAQKFGYKRIIYTTRSSRVLENLTDFVKFGTKVIGTCGTKYFKNSGLILDISEVKLGDKE